MSNDKPTCSCGCGAHVSRKDARFLPGHNRRVYEIPLTDRYDVDHETGCWIWNRTVTATGYGQWAIGKRRVGAHREMYIRLVGAIPDGHQLHHTCVNRACVNPDHLVPLTPEAHGEVHRAETCGKGHPLDDSNTYRGAARRQCRTCAAEARQRYNDKHLLKAVA